jgi:hypothetical protein
MSAGYQASSKARSSKDTANGEMDLADRVEVARYIAKMSASLARMARRHNFDALGYVLDMAHSEAEGVSRQSQS